jgi:signal peptidase I
MSRKNALSTGTMVILAVAFTGLFGATFFDIVRVAGHSMEPTIRNGQVLVINRAAYGIQVPLLSSYLIRWSAPVPGDIVLFKSPVEDRLVVKRCAPAGLSSGVFALGDNSANSFDSRDYGPVPVSEIRGKVLFQGPPEPKQ